MAKTRLHGKTQVTRNKSGTKCDLQAPHGGLGYHMTVHLSENQLSTFLSTGDIMSKNPQLALSRRLLHLKGVETETYQDYRILGC